MAFWITDAWQTDSWVSVQEFTGQNESKENNAFLLASHLPQGRLWEGGFDSTTNLGRLISALSIEFYRLSILAGKYVTEMDINQTSELLIEWEQSVGIPNSYFSSEGETIERRRAQVEQLFSNFGGVQTGNDLVRVALFFGFDIQVWAGVDYAGGSVTFPLTFPLIFTSDLRTITHTIYIDILDAGMGGVFFPLKFPIQFSVGGETFLRLIFEVLIPANVQLIFI